MLVECLIEREGFTSVTIQRSRYEFKRNEENRQVCDVLSGSHLEYLLKLDDFVLYAPPEQKVEKIEKVYSCDKCGKTFDHHLALSGHKRSKECINEQTAGKGNSKVAPQ